MDNRPDPEGVMPPSQLGAPPSPPNDFADSPELGTPYNPNAGLAKPSPKTKLGGMDRVRNLVTRKPAVAVALAALAGLGLTAVLRLRRA